MREAPFGDVMAVPATVHQVINLKRRAVLHEMQPGRTPRSQSSAGDPVRRFRQPRSGSSSKNSRLDIISSGRLLLLVKELVKRSERLSAHAVTRLLELSSRP